MLKAKVFPGKKSRKTMLRWHQLQLSSCVDHISLFLQSFVSLTISTYYNLLFNIYEKSGDYVVNIQVLRCIFSVSARSSSGVKGVFSFFFFFFLYLLLFICLTAPGLSCSTWDLQIFSGSMQDLVPWSEIYPWPPAF